MFEISLLGFVPIALIFGLIGTAMLMGPVVWYDGNLPDLEDGIPAKRRSEYKESLGVLFGLLSIVAIIISFGTPWWAASKGYLVNVRGLTEGLIAESPVDLNGLKALTENLSNIDDLSVSEIRSTLENIQKINKEVIESVERQSKEMAALREDLAREEAETKKAQEISIALKKISREEIEAVKFVLTEDSKLSSQYYFIIGALSSIVIGFFVSFASPILRKRFLRSGSK